ncbi:hypothetical protein [Methanobrevibacter sp.]|jgi:hypothetical protein|uniref:hypothetical protein n=1 Tax=Methanobrevibacter sp. TaxID=66852 RepID=UPI00386FFC3C
MPRGGFFAGGDYVPYMPGTLSYSTPTSVREFRKQETAFCPKCKRTVPLKDRCVFCDNILE